MRLQKGADYRSTIKGNSSITLVRPPHRGVVMRCGCEFHRRHDDARRRGAAVIATARPTATATAVDAVEAAVRPAPAAAHCETDSRNHATLTSRTFP